jgi:hypothetical protein
MPDAIDTYQQMLAPSINDDFIYGVCFQMHAHAHTFLGLWCAILGLIISGPLENERDRGDSRSHTPTEIECRARCIRARVRLDSQGHQDPPVSRSTSHSRNTRTESGSGSQ